MFVLGNMLRSTYRFDAKSITLKSQPDTLIGTLPYTILIKGPLSHEHAGVRVERVREERPAFLATEWNAAQGV